MSTLFPPLLASQIPTLFYMFPVTAVIALVYSASRYEDAGAILRKSCRLFSQISVFLVGILLRLYVLTVKLEPRGQIPSLGKPRSRYNTLHTRHAPLPREMQFWRA
ncbi:MAG: hypothetical protein R3C12_26325 [Planctomycetaceae bacterium]